MKKGFKVYAIAWAILLIVFNVICFVTPSEAGGMSKFGGAFWAGYAFITAAFIGQLACAAKAFNAENLQKFFYNIPLISISYGGLIVMFIVGGAVMAIPGLPNWAGIIVCMLVLAFTAISVIKAQAAATLVEQTDEKVKVNTSFIRELRVEAESLLAHAKTIETKAVCKKVSEAVKYQDPVSSDALADIEAEIAEKFTTFAAKVKASENDGINETAEELTALLDERGKRCKAVK